MSVDPFLSKVEKIYTFIVHPSVVLGGLISLAWFAGSLLLYWQLDRPVWELASLVAVSLFVFSWFCVREFSRRSLRASAGKLPDDGSGQEDREGKEELEGHLAEIEEGMSEARCGGKKTIIYNALHDALTPLSVPFVMLMITGFFWEAWADGSEWLCAPGGMAAVIAASLVLACVGVRIVSWYFSPDEAGTQKESLRDRRSE